MGRHAPSTLALIAIAGMASFLHAQQLKRLHTYLVFGEDDRVPAGNTAVRPWSSVGLILAHWGEAGGFQVRIGTGTLISDHVVLTAGHVVFDAGVGWAQAIFFIPGANSQTDPFATYEAAEAITTEQWAAGQNDEHDLAMLRLDEPAGQSAGFMRVVGQPPSFFDNRVLEMSGYPSDLIWDQLYSAAGEVQGLDGNLIRHYIDGAEGQSGGPIWYNDPGTGEATLVGVYGGDVEITRNGQVISTYGYGIPINATFCTWVSDYVSRNDPDTVVSCDAARDATPSIATGLCGAGAAGPALLAATLCFVSQSRRASRRGARAASS